MAVKEKLRNEKERENHADGAYVDARRFRAPFLHEMPAALKLEELGIYVIFLITSRNVTLYLCSMLG